MNETKWLTGTDGEVLSATTDNRTYLRFRNDPLGGWSQAKVSVARAPVAVTVNGAALPRSDWVYSPGEQLLAARNSAKAGASCVGRSSTG